MTPSISCPSCARSLGRVHPDGISQLVCSSCRKRFGVVHGKLSSWFSKWEAMLYLSPKLPSFYKRRYELGITTPGRDLKVLKFSMAGKEDRVPVRPGDRISILYSLKGSGMKKLISIYNHTIGKTYYLPSPIPSTHHLLTTRGVLSAGVLLYAILSGVGGALIYGTWAIAVFAYAQLVDAAELFSPQLRSDVSAEARLLEERNLLDQKVLIEHRISSIQQDRYSHQELIQRLQSLRRRMLGVGPSLYATRVANIEKAIRLLKHRIHHDQRLIDEYAQTVKMIEIELETSYLTDHVPELEGFTGDIAIRLNELKAIEERNRNLWLQLEANEEVRRLNFGT